MSLLPSKPCLIGYEHEKCISPLCRFALISLVNGAASNFVCLVSSLCSNDKKNFLFYIKISCLVCLQLAGQIARAATIFRIDEVCFLMSFQFYGLKDIYQFFKSRICFSGGVPGIFFNTRAPRIWVAGECASYISG